MIHLLKTLLCTAAGTAGKQSNLSSLPGMRANERSQRRSKSARPDWRTKDDHIIHINIKSIWHELWRFLERSAFSGPEVLCNFFSWIILHRFQPDDIHPKFLSDHLRRKCRVPLKRIVYQRDFHTQDSPVCSNR
ncbi:hypothetical protein SDC9_108111 [bioreactor metagenome]|uniref:Uncharacterized protein n=1 Tax=bioreactor metagenome TaxID=1076179 RepID=A0A645BDJ5_9ZZZZ